MYARIRTTDGYGAMLATRLVKKLEPPVSGSRITYDFVKGDDPTKAVRGFGLRTTAAGAKSFILNYRADGIERRLTIGSFPTWSVVQAREEARRLRREIDEGEDPLAEREAERTAPTVARLAERYCEEHLPRKRPGSARDDQAMLRGWILPALGSKKVAAIRPNDIAALHAKITKTGATTRANRVIGLLSMMLSLAVRWDYVDRNVARGTWQRNPETKRKRYLSPAEIARLTAALEACLSQRAADAIRLLLLTGARKTEVTAARWEQFDLTAGTWAKPAAATKQKADHYVPLSAPTLQLLNAIGPKANGYLFPGHDGNGYLHIRGTWDAVRKAAGIEDVHLHDLRHSFASILVSSGASLPLIGALLGHSNPTTTARYAHLFLDPLRAAAEQVGAIVSGKPTGEVIEINGSRKARAD
jgi:integrase